MSAKNHHPRIALRAAGAVAAAAIVIGSVLISPMTASSVALTAISPIDVGASADLPEDVVGAPVNRSILPSDELLVTRTSGPPAGDNNSSQSRAAGNADSSALTLNTDPTTVPDTPTRAVQASFPTESGRFTTADVDQALAFQNVTAGGGSNLQLSDISTYPEAQSPGWDSPIAISGAPQDGNTIGIGAGGIFYLAISNAGAATSAELGSAVTSAEFLDGDQEQLSIDQQWTVIAQTGGGFWLQNRADGTCMEASGQGQNNSAVVTDICDTSNSAQTWQFVNVGENAWQLRSLPFGSAVTNGPDNDAPVLYDPAALGNTPTIFWIIDEGRPVPATWSVTNDVGSEDTPIDLAAGDLDDSIDSQLNYHDEAAVAYLGADNAITVSVVDFNANPDHSSQLVTTVDNVGTVGTSWGPVTVDIADFDGDGGNEIAVTWTTADGTTSVAFLEYADGATVDPTTGAGQRTLTVSSVVPLGIKPFWTTQGLDTTWADSAAWNFDLLGGADLAFVYPDASNSSVPTLGYFFFDSDFALTNSYTTPINDGDSTPVTQGLSQHDTVLMDTGSFDPQYAGQPGYRQLAIAVPYQQEQVATLFIWEYTPASGSTPQSAAIIAHDPGNFGVFQVTDGLWGMDMAAGVLGDASDEGKWSVTVSFVYSPEFGDDYYAYLFTMSINDDGTVSSFLNALEALPQSAGPFANHYSLTSYDRTGQSLVLGAPLVFTVDQLKQLDLVAGQPPGHSDWLDGAFQEVSRTDQFNVNIGSTTSAGYSNTSAHESDQSYAVSQTEDLTATTKVGIPFIASGQFSLNVAENFNKTWSSKQSSLSQFSSTTSTAVSQATADDDIVDAEVQTFRVLRYPVIGTAGRTDSADGSCDAGCSGYWEITIPGSVESLSGDGKSMDFFQPDWSNGNALSYPAIDNGTITLADIGTYTANGVASSAPLINDIRQLGGTSATVQLSVSDTSGTTTSESTSQSWNVGADVTTTVKAGVGIPGEGQESINNQFGVGFNAANSFTDSTTGSTTNSHGQSFALTVPSINDDYEYTIGTSYYYTTGGYPKVAYSVDLTDGAESAGFWGPNYGVDPDPALNLPYATFTVDNPVGVRNITKWDPVDTAQMIRGFVAHQPADPSSPTTSGAPYASAPAPGAPVIFDIPVHNYSLVDLNEPLDVAFYAVPVDARNARVTGSPISLGNTDWTGGIPSQGEVTISSPSWSAVAGLDGTLQQYRVFAVVDPDDTIAEVHGWAGDGSNTCPTSSVQGGTALIDPMTGATSTLECGQNNQGYGLISVGNATTVEGPADVTLDGGAIRADRSAPVELDETSAVPTFTRGTRLTGYVDMKAASDSADNQTVLIYDGEPSDGKLVASTTVRGVAAGKGGSASFSWTPEEPGLHELHQVILGTESAGARDEQIMRVEVVESGSPGGGSGSGSGSGPAGTPPSGAGAGSGALAATGTDLGGALALAAVAVSAGAILLFIRRRRSARS
ncbi:RICIN domain-containing protein [Herbiconiux solani]|uniref:RICIN domain-containing protein n=1 Tax=Herbiconiux solani TaxID=661329 RepID=UPI000826707B|nr:RICIN domain-containing protein [Herbiconiux solani]